MAAPNAKDWTRIYIAQRADAGKRWGDFTGKDGKPVTGKDGKKVPRMPAVHARELLRYWTAAAAEQEGLASKKTQATRDRLKSASEKFKNAMEPFAASVLLDLPARAKTAEGVNLSRSACESFWAAVWQLCSSLSAARVAPPAADLWWQALGESARELATKASNVLETGASWAGLALVVVAGLVLMRR